jgi:hypothetical protein
MAMRGSLRFLVAVVSLATGNCASSAQPTHSTFCALVGSDMSVLADVVAELDEFARGQALKRGTPSPNGIVYAGPDKQFIINVVPVGPRGVEVAFFPREPNTFSEEAAQLETFVMQTLASRFPAVQCEDVAGYGKGAIYGYDRIAI